MLDTVCPFILSVHDKKRRLSGREMGLHLSALARQAVEMSARKSDILLGDLLKDDNGAPLPFNGNYWSLSHKPKYVVGVAAPARIGIDIEEIRPCRESLFRKTADDREWGLTGGDRFKLLFRYWTSKEAVLKAVGTGLKDLSKCSVAQVVDDNSLVINYRGKEWLMEHLFFNGHIVSVVKNSFCIRWTLDSVHTACNTL